MVWGVGQQRGLLRQGVLKGTDGLTCKDFQQTASLEQFAVFVKQYPLLSQSQGPTSTARTIEDQTGTVTGTLTARDQASILRFLAGAKSGEKLVSALCLCYHLAHQPADLSRRWYRDRAGNQTGEKSIRHKPP
jgi:hypothetical protein